MRGKFYTTSENAWEGMLQAIIGAKESIYLEMYIFDGDTQGYDFLNELEIKARAGIRVIIILDALGSSALANSAIERLKSVGVEVLFFSYWFRRTHRKMLIIDEHMIFLGGVNISKQFASWNDLQVRVSGRIARIAVQSFAHIYHECGGKNPELLNATITPKLVRRARTWFMESGVREKFLGLRTHYEKNIDAAEKSIFLVTPYLVPHPWMVSHIHRAITRGVNITIMIPEKTDYAFIDRINYYFAHQFEKIGVRCLLGDNMNHAKIMLVDEKVGTMGSQNLDILSFNWNVESGIFFENKDMVKKISAIIRTWVSASREFPHINYEPRWYDIIVAHVLRIFTRT